MMYRHRLISSSDLKGILKSSSGLPLELTYPKMSPPQQLVHSFTLLGLRCHMYVSSETTGKMGAIIAGKIFAS